MLQKQIIITTVLVLAMAFLGTSAKAQTVADVYAKHLENPQVRTCILRYMDKAHTDNALALLIVLCAKEVGLEMSRKPADERRPQLREKEGLSLEEAQRLLDKK